MAGEGRRFMGPKIPKPLIKLAGKELIKWAVNSYNLIDYCLDWSDLYFITRLDHIEDFQMDKLLKRFFSPKINIRYVEKTTRGPAQTALLVEKDISPQEQVIISDCDMFFNSLPLFAQLLKIKKDDSVWAILPYVKREDNQNSWSYLKLGKNNQVTKIAEKDREMFDAGAPGIVGAYAFNCWCYFVNEAKKMIEEDDLCGEEQKREFYLSRIFHRIVKAGRLVKGVDVYPSWILGTPEQCKTFNDLIKRFKT